MLFPLSILSTKECDTGKRMPKRTRSICISKKRKKAKSEKREEERYPRESGISWNFYGYLTAIDGWSVETSSKRLHPQSKIPEDVPGGVFEKIRKLS